MLSVALGGVILPLFVAYVCCEGGFEGREEEEEIHSHLCGVLCTSEVVGFFFLSL